MGAAGRDFHNFNVYFRDNQDYEVVAFTATQIPDIEGRTYPPQLAGKLYPKGIPIFAETDLLKLIKKYKVEQVIFAYSGNVRIGENNLFDLVFFDQLEQVGLGKDGNTFWIQFPSKLRRIRATLDVGDLGCSESHHFIVLVIAEIDIEIVEVAPGGAHDESSSWQGQFSPRRPGASVHHGHREQPAQQDRHHRNPQMPWQYHKRCWQSRAACIRLPSAELQLGSAKASQSIPLRRV